MPHYELKYPWSIHLSKTKSVSHPRASDQDFRGAVSINFVCLLHQQRVWSNFNMQVILLVFDTKKECIIVNLPSPEFSNAGFLVAIVDIALRLGISGFYLSVCSSTRHLVKSLLIQKPLFQIPDSYCPYVTRSWLCPPFYFSPRFL